MTQRERHATAGMSATASPASPSGPALPSRPVALANGSTTHLGLWETFLQGASADRQAELLSLVERQGLLYVHQLPVPANGHRHATEESDGAKLVARLLEGKLGDLPVVKPTALTLADDALDSSQREAVTRAVETPDVALIQGLPGSGKSRVVAEIVTQAVRRGERVLLLAASGAGLDCVLEFLRGREEVLAIRCLSRDENVEALSPVARAALLAEKARSLREQTLTRARLARDEADRRCHDRRREEQLWPRFHALLEERRPIAEAHQRILLERAALPDAVEAEAKQANKGTMGKAIGQAVGQLGKALARLSADLAKIDAEREAKGQSLDRIANELTVLSPLAAARQQGRWWTATWWKAKWKGDLTAPIAVLRKSEQDLQADLADLASRAAQNQIEQQAAKEKHQGQLRHIVETEIKRRQAALDNQLAELNAQLTKIDGNWEQLAQGMQPATLRPVEMNQDAVNAAHLRWQNHLQQDEESCAFAKKWLSFLKESGDHLAATLPGYANLVAATASGLAASEHFGDPGTSGGLFDLLIFEDAELASEQDFLKAARRARRWILVGDSSGETVPASSARPDRPTPGPRQCFFQRLWRQLHCDPSQLPFSWVREGERLCCRLRQVATDQRHRLEKEHLTDAQDIELRILTLPRMRPALVEVVFPPTMPIEQAKEFIFHELDELPLQTSGRTMNWEESESCVTLRFFEASGEIRSAVLERGVRECVVCGPADSPGVTSRLEFDREEGWDRARAQAWVVEHLHLLDLGRTTRLERLHRMRPALAAVIADVAFNGAYGVPTPTDRVVVIEFIAVPGSARRKEPERHRRDSNGHRSQDRLPHGAGLEVDLSLPRPVDRWPADLKLSLPARGYVNLVEAKAVVQKLEEIATTPGEKPRVGIVALYSGQVTLLKHLIGASAILAKNPLTLEVDLPTGFRHREFPVVLVSLTRSHSHRAVPFGEGAPALTQALTRATRRLIVFGDPGTLSRRSQWQGALEPLDETASAREGQFISQLVRYLLGNGRHAWAFHVVQGSGG